jgi:hypothetical protein
MTQAFFNVLMLVGYVVPGAIICLLHRSATQKSR